MELDIETDLSMADAQSLAGLLSRVACAGMDVVDVGCYKGMSSSLLATAAKQYQGRVFSVDPWEDPQIYETFLSNMRILGFEEVVYPLRKRSVEAAQEVPNGVLDLVFIDADHHYERAKEDIVAWLPKLREGGILCGHDCEGHYASLPEDVKQQIDENLEEAFVPTSDQVIACAWGEKAYFYRGFHPGVIHALYDIFKDEYTRLPGTLWCCVRVDPLLAFNPFNAFATKGGPLGYK